MIKARIDNRKSIPWWAALGAPLVGIPLLVALLALTAPAEQISAIDEDAVVHSEQLEVQTVEHAVEGLIEAPRLEI